MADKDFQKITIKIIISVEQCIPVSNFNSFGKLQILGPNLQKNYDKTFEKIYTKIVISTQQCITVRNFCQLEELQIFGPNLPQNI